MKIREITIGDLPDFVQSEEYSRLEPKPITLLRAISQSKNPDAKKDDVALIFVSENNVLLAFVGLLPNSANNNSAPIFSNTGWWVHPERGKKLGLPLILKAFQICQKHMFFTDCTAHTKSILEKTGLFTFMPPKTGIRFFLRFYFEELVKKRQSLEFAAPMFYVFDKITNGFLSPFHSLWIKKFDDKEYNLIFKNKLDPELDEFIQKHSENKFLKQSINKLNWIIQNPWITNDETRQQIDYPFSHLAKNFRQEFLVIKKENTVIALLMLSIRDNHLSVPFAYYETKELNIIAKMIWLFALKNKVNSLIIYNTKLLDALKKVGSPAIYNSKIIRYMGYSNELNSIFASEKQFQDGEADVAFT